MLIEQPELHLHARAQARLGDFFLGLTRVGKQCIIETHSDCLVNQLRLHMVKDGPSARENIAIYFVEQDERGDARFVPVEISATGNIVNWPDGFFDESLHQEDRITREAVLARANRA
jgi:predicted ATPase